MAVVPAPEIYDPSRAFGDFAIRVLQPQPMDAPHWHGHVEINMLAGAAMDYDFDGARVCVADGGAALFWAGVPHRASSVRATGAAEPSLTNIYLPLDAFLLMPHVGALQQAVLSGGVIAVPPALIDAGRLARWRADLAAGTAERQALVKMELNAALRRLTLDGLTFLLRPADDGANGRKAAASNARHVVAMVRVIIENLGRPLSNAEVTRVTGLHMNYALALFSSVMRIPLKRFIIRMRLARARALLTESDLPAATIAAQSGFGSLSQFYEAFRAAYGTTPKAARLKGVNRD